MWNAAGETVRHYVDRLLAAAGLPESPSRVLLLCYPRVFGYVFNPISVYFAYGRDGELAAMIYAVRNTFGERHTYVAPVRPGELGPAGVRQERTKVFHVSPFIDMGTRYHFRVLPPGKTVRLRIHETEKRRAAARRNLRRRSEKAGHIDAVSLPLEDSLHDVEDYSGDPLGSVETVVERSQVSQEPATTRPGEFPRRTGWPSHEVARVVFGAHCRTSQGVLDNVDAMQFSAAQ